MGRVLLGIAVLGLLASGRYLPVSRSWRWRRWCSRRGQDDPDEDFPTWCDPSTILGLPRQRFEPIMFSRFNQIRIDSRNKHFGSSPRSSEGNGGNKEGSAY